MTGHDGRRVSPNLPRRLVVRPLAAALLAGAFLTVRVPALSPGSGVGFALPAALVAAVVSDVLTVVFARRSGAAVVEQASVVTVGEPWSLQICLQPGLGVGRVADIAVRLSGAVTSDERHLRPGASGTNELVACGAVRGCYEWLQVDVTRSGPLGLVAFERTVFMPLVRRLAVGPKPVPYPEALHAALSQIEHSSKGRSQLAGDLFRGVRAFQPGDSLRQVHWPLVARTGELLVRDFDNPTRPAVRLGVDLGRTAGPNAEQVAGQAAWLALELLRRNVSVVLDYSGTAAPATPRRVEVASLTTVAAALAEAVTTAAPRVWAADTFVVHPDGFFVAGAALESGGDA